MTVRILHVLAAAAVGLCLVVPGTPLHAQQLATDLVCEEYWPSLVPRLRDSHHHPPALLAGPPSWGASEPTIPAPPPIRFQ
jgi:hypothetical protein